MGWIYKCTWELIFWVSCTWPSDEGSHRCMMNGTMKKKKKKTLVSTHACILTRERERGYVYVSNSRIAGVKMRANSRERLLSKYLESESFLIASILYNFFNSNIVIF